MVSMSFLLVSLLLWGCGSYCIFQNNKAFLFLPYDGAYMQQLIKFNFEWSNFSLNPPINPLQGLASLNWPLNYWLSPSCNIIRAIGVSPENKVLYSVVSGSFLFLSVYCLASCFPSLKKTRLLASWLSVLFVMPVIMTPNKNWILGFYAISGIFPSIVESIALVGFACACLFAAQTKDCWGWLLHLCAGVLTAWQISFCPLAGILGTFLIGIVFAWEISQRARMTKYIPLSLFGVIIDSLAFILPILGPVVFLTTWTMDTVAPFFSSELVLGRPEMLFISILFHGFKRIGWMSSIIWVLGFAGAWCLRKKGGELEKQYTSVYFATVLFLIAFGFISSFLLSNYRGPSMLYFEWMLWPLMFINTAFLIGSVVGDKISKKTSLLLNRLSPNLPIHNISTLLLALLSLFVLLKFQKHYNKQELPFPPVGNAAIDFLRKEIGLSPGGVFKGSSATFAQSESLDASSWEKQAAEDLALWNEYGTETRAVTLWQQGIPTLFSYNQYMPPEYYFICSRFLAKEADKQQRSIIVMTQPNIKILQMLGVKYVLSKTEKLICPENLKSTNLFQLPSLKGKDKSSQSLYILELPRPNIGNFTPTTVMPSKNLQVIKGIIGSESFNPEQHVILSSAHPGNLVPAMGGKIAFKKNKVLVNGESQGESILVLPIVFSNVLKIKNTEPGKCKIVRANLLQAGVIFSGKLNAEIYPEFGPYSNLAAKLFDWHEFRKILVAD